MGLEKSNGQKKPPPDKRAEGRAIERIVTARSGLRNNGCGLEPLAEIPDGAHEPVAKLDSRIPAEFPAGERDVRLPLDRVVRRERAVDYLLA